MSVFATPGANAACRVHASCFCPCGLSRTAGTSPSTGSPTSERSTLTDSATTLWSLLDLLGERQIVPLLGERIPFRDVRRSTSGSGHGGVTGKIVLVSTGTP
jgi:hypothetical protein